MNTPTNQPSDKCAALARSLMIWIKQDDVGHEFVAHQLAELESIAVADMTAHAEAAEAALIEHKSAMGYLLGQFTAAHLDHVSQTDIGSRISNLVKESPAETRSVIAELRELHAQAWGELKLNIRALGELRDQKDSVIAGLREEVAKSNGEWATLMSDVQQYFAEEKADRGRGRVTLVLTLLGQLRIERDALRTRVAELENEIRQARRAWLGDDYGHLPLIDAMEKYRYDTEAQLAALISAGDSVVARMHERMAVFGCNVSDDAKVLAWQAAVSGAQAGARGGDNLAELREDKARLDFIEEIHSITDNSSPLWKSILTDIAEKGYRKAIDIARSKHP